MISTIRPTFLWLWRRWRGHWPCGYQLVHREWQIRAPLSRRGAQLSWWILGLFRRLRPWLLLRGSALQPQVRFLPLPRCWPWVLPHRWAWDWKCPEFWCWYLHHQWFTFILEFGPCFDSLVGGDGCCDYNKFVLGWWLDKFGCIILLFTFSKFEGFIVGEEDGDFRSWCSDEDRSIVVVGGKFNCFFGWDSVWWDEDYSLGEGSEEGEILEGH